MMKDLITEARELCADATPGPWEVVGEDAWRMEGFPQVEMNTPDGKYFPVHNDTDAAFIARSRTLIPELCDALEKAEERGQGCEHCQGWDTRSGAQYCPMCGKKLPVYAGTIGGEIVQHALKELGAEEGAEHERD